MCIGLITAVTGCQRKGNEKVHGNEKEHSEMVDESISSVPKTTTTTEPEKTKREINSDDKLIALTFDDGPYSPVTEKILDTLEANGAVATFFVVGERVDGSESYRKSLKRAYDMGCQIGSHTYSHKLLKSGVSAGTVKDEIDKSLAAIKNVTGEDAIIMRPPGGFCNENISLPEIMWSVDSRDWKNRDAAKNYDSVINSVYDGSIILMHDLYPATADSIERIVPALIADGYKFVTVSELMEARGITMENGHSYSQAKPQVQESTTEAAE